MNVEANRVVAFWFNRNPMEWIVAPEGLDEQIKSDYGNLIQQARRGELDSWVSDAESSVALVALLDQFSRNMFRGTPEAYSADDKALEIASKAIAQGFDRKVPVIQAMGLYMPLMQHESLISIIAARSLFEALKGRCTSDEENMWVDMSIKASNGHMNQLERFGRYPTRNAVLGRKTTEAEQIYLRDRVVSL